MASDAVSLVSTSPGDVWRRPLVFVHLEAPIAGGDDASRLETLAEHDGHEHRPRGSRRHDDPAGRLWAVPARASADHCSGGVDRCLAVLRPASVRAHALGPRRDLEFSRRRAARQLSLPTAGCLAMVHGKYRRPPHPSFVQSNSLLSLAGRVARQSAVRWCRADYAAPEFADRAADLVGRGAAAARLLWRGGLVWKGSQACFKKEPWSPRFRFCHPRAAAEWRESARSERRWAFSARSRWPRRPTSGAGSRVTDPRSFCRSDRARASAARRPSACVNRRI